MRACVRACVRAYIRTYVRTYVRSGCHSNLDSDICHFSLLTPPLPPNVTNMRVTFGRPRPTPLPPPRNHVIVTGCVFGLAWATFTFEQRCFIIAVYDGKTLLLKMRPSGGSKHCTKVSACQNQPKQCHNHIGCRCPPPQHVTQDRVTSLPLRLPPPM